MAGNANTLLVHASEYANEKAAATLVLIPEDERLDKVQAPLFAFENGAFISPNISYAQGCVRQNGRYNLKIEFPEGKHAEYYEAAIFVNGSEEIVYTPDYGQAAYSDDGLILKPADQAILPFSLVCGHARIRVELYGYTGELEASFYSSGILCEQEHEINNKAVEEMIDALMGDPAQDKALEWMTRSGDTADNEPYSLLEGGYKRGAARSIPTYLSIIEAGLDSTEAALPYIRGHAAGRISHVEDVIDSRKVRHLGPRETSWIATHPEVLRPAAGSKCPINYCGRQYTPAKVSSTRTFRNLNVYENQLCLSFLSSIAANLTDFENKLAENLASINPACANRGNADTGKILLVALARALQSRHRVYSNKANSLRERALRLLRAYQCALPGVETRSLHEMRLVRTKIFKEVRAYSQVYPSIERFAFFGESLLHADGLSIATLRLDRVYETYALYRMLSWMAENGFSPNGETPIFAGKYGYSTEVYSDTPHVSNVYHLKRGRTRVSLFYEPVCFASAKEENGITLHRMRASRYGHAEFTPDYVLAVEHDHPETGTTRKVFILDAKYRSRWTLTHQYTDERTGETKPNVFQISAEKYMLNTIDAATGKIPDSIWLLSGKQDHDPEIMPLSALPWDSVRAPAHRSGIALLTPETSLDQLFHELGIPAREASAPMKCEEARKEEKEQERKAEKEKQLQREEKHRIKKERKAKEAKESKQKKTSRTNNQQADEISRIVLELLQILTNGTDEILYNARKCRMLTGSDKPILRKQAAKDYRILPGYNDLFYYCPKVPTYAHLLRRYAAKLKASQNHS